MSVIDEIITELNELLSEGFNFLPQKQKNEKGEVDIFSLTLNYQPWYTKALSAIRQLIPEREADFVAAYKLDKRKEITADTYCISDYLQGLNVTRGGSEVFSSESSYTVKLMSQLAIVKSASESAKSKLRDISTVLRAELLDGDVECAKELLKKNHIRSAGVICGVVLESHLKSVCERRNIKFRKKNLAISDLNDALKNDGAFDTPMWRFIQRLGDIRNYCVHSKERDPTTDEVADLISGTEKVIKEVF